MTEAEGKERESKNKTFVKKFEDWSENHVIIAPLIIASKIAAGLLGLLATVAGYYAWIAFLGHFDKKPTLDVPQTAIHPEAKRSETFNTPRIQSNYNKELWDRIEGKLDK